MPGRSVFALCLLLLPPAAVAELTVTYRTPESASDRRYDYDNAVLELALQKTRREDGPYRLQASPPMNYSRAILEASRKSYPNFFIKLSYEDRLSGMGLAYARFPVDLGIVGYRVCFVRSDLKAKLGGVTRLEELRRYSHGQGAGWADVGILRANGFKVQEVSSYESLFPMVAAGRFDLLCRGANELLDEYRLHRSISGLAYDSSFALVYPLPRFFFTSRENGKAIERVTRGLEIAYRDGSLQKLWEAQYRESVDFAKLRSRRIFRLENPLIRNIDFDFRKYDYDPLKP